MNNKLTPQEKKSLYVADPLWYAYGFQDGKAFDKQICMPFCGRDTMKSYIDGYVDGLLKRARGYLGDFS